MGHKAVETTCNINNIFGPGTANKHTGHWWFKNFCKGNESLEDEECSGQPLEVDNNQLRAIIKKPILLQLHEKLLKSSTLTILWSFGIWSKLERWKSLVSGCLVIWPQIEIIILKCRLLLFYAATVNRFLTGLCRAMKSRFYMTTRDNQLTKWTKKKLQSASQSQTRTKKWSQSLSGSLLPVWPTTPFWIPVKSCHWRSVLSKSMRCTENCDTHSWHWSTERAHFFSTTMPDHTSHNQHFKSWTIWAMKFCLFHHIHLTSCQPTTTSSSISTTLCGENASTTSRRQKMLPKSSLNAEAQIFMPQE